MSLKHLVDATLLDTTKSPDDYRELDRQATNCASVCVHPQMLKYITHPNPCVVVNFPHGGELNKTVEYSILDSIENGANEIDIVVDINAAIYGDAKVIQEGLFKVRKLTNKIIKVILETGIYRNEEHLLNVASAAVAAEVDFLKTSTGFGPRGATVADIQLLAENFPNVALKASGGIKTLEFAHQLVDAGATRIGVSNLTWLED